MKFFSWWDWAGKICWLNEYSILLVDLIILQYFLSFETTLSTSSVIFLAIPSPCNHLAAPWLISSPRWYKKFTARLLEHHYSAWIHVHCWLREDINRKKTFSFGHCPNEGGGVYPCPNFLALFQEVHFWSIKRVYFFKNSNVLKFYLNARKKTFFSIDVFPKYGVSREQQAEC